MLPRNFHNTASGGGTGLALLLTLLFFLLAAGSADTAMAGVGPTVREVIEFTRIIQPLNHDNDALQNQVSPDGELAFIVTRKADVATDVNRFEILLLDVGVDRLAAGRAAPPVVVLTVDARRDESEINAPLREARWIGNRTIVFRARMNDEPFQVYSLDVLTRRMKQLTQAPLGLVAFDVPSDLRRVVYVAPEPNPAMPPGARSVVVGTHSFWSVHFGQDDFRTQQRRYRYFVAEAGSRMPARPLGESFAESSGGFPSTSLSPDGRWLVLPTYEPDRQLAWGRQYPQIAEATATYGPSLTADPLGYYSRPMTYVVRRMVAYRLADGHEQAIVEAPDDSLPNNQLRTDRLWQDGGKSVVIAGTYLPSGEGRKGAEGALQPPASHIIEYWPDTGRWTTIAALQGRLKASHPIAGRPGAFLVIDGERRRCFERGAGEGWREVPEEQAAVAGQRQSAYGDGARGEWHLGEGHQRKWHLRVREALNQPPDIVAVGASGAMVRLTELNPQFSPSWGTMREYSWKDRHGRTWNGGLMVPAGFDPVRRHAVVIQTYGFSGERFYRDGSNTRDGFTSGFAGRAFLRENILVLALPWTAASGGATDERGQRTTFSEGALSAIDALAAEPWVDRDRIGIMGWSATGDRVLNLLTFTDAPVRAASLLDGDANTLYSMAITYSVMDGVQARKEQANEGGPYGESRERWVRNDPSLHTDCIRAALRIETYGPEVHNNWDIYALLRRQYRPVEMIMFPEGAHALSRPSERMISMQGNVDWYRFWLKGERRSELVVPTETATSLKAQYERWEQMEALKRAVDAKPGCTRP